MTTETERVTAFWTELGLPGIIDVHTHFMPHNVMEKVWAYFDQAGPLTGRPWPINYRVAEDERVEILRAFGIRAFTSLLYPHKRDMAAWLNEWAGEFADRTPDCLRTATFYPEPFVDSYVDAAINAGTRVFKSHIQVGEYHPNDPLLHPVWDMLEDAGIPTVIHCGSGPAPGLFTGPEPIARVLKRHPRLPLIIAHMGMPEYAEFIELALKYPSVRLDTTMVFTDFLDDMGPLGPEVLPKLVDLKERILFGSDFPNIPYGYDVALHGLARLGLGDNWLRAVCHDNAAKLFGVE
jgi:uncharacterized protein